tara:strand:- start:1420 stop:1728 length:309 start_codon:yes stop_codon:yes gene_type:complete
MGVNMNVFSDKGKVEREEQEGCDLERRFHKGKGKQVWVVRLSSERWGYNCPYLTKGLGLRRNLNDCGVGCWDSKEEAAEAACAYFKKVDAACEYLRKEGGAA